MFHAGFDYVLQNLKVKRQNWEQNDQNHVV